MSRLSQRLSPQFAGLLCAVGLLSAGAPAFGQERVGQFAENSGHGLSASVAYQDLDLTTLAGRNELRRRVWTTARKLCSRLSESEASSAAAPSCEDLARIDVAETQRAIIAQAISPGLRVARGPETPIH
jgi:UrcA family protein